MEVAIKVKRENQVEVSIYKGIYIAFFAMLMFFTLHKVNEGHIAVYYRGGALLQTTANPGYNVMFPFITTYRLVQTTMQTHSVRNVPCQTRGGVSIYFDIEIVTTVMPQAVYDLVRKYTADYEHDLVNTPVLHVINKFCSQHTMQEVYFAKYEQMDDITKKALEGKLKKMSPGLYVQVVRVTKPKIPEDIQRNFELIEKEKAELLVANERQKRVEKEAEISRRKAVLEAEKAAEVARIEHNQRIMETELQKKIAEIENAAKLDQMKAQAEAESFKAAEEAKIKAAKELAEREALVAYYLPFVALGMFVSIWIVCLFRCCRRKIAQPVAIQTTLPTPPDSDDSSSSEDEDVPTTSAYPSIPGFSRPSSIPNPPSSGQTSPSSEPAPPSRKTSLPSRSGPPLTKSTPPISGQTLPPSSAPSLSRPAPLPSRKVPLSSTQALPPSTVHPPPYELIDSKYHPGTTPKQTL